MEGTQYRSSEHNSPFSPSSRSHKYRHALCKLRPNIDRMMYPFNSVSTFTLMRNRQIRRVGGMVIRIQVLDTIVHEMYPQNERSQAKKVILYCTLCGARCANYGRHSIQCFQYFVYPSEDIRHDLNSQLSTLNLNHQLQTESFENVCNLCFVNLHPRPGVWNQMSPSTASEVFFGSIAFPLHLSLWVIILKNVPGKNRQLAEEELNTTTLEESRVQHNSDWELKRAGTIHKSESEYSLGLNRSESIAFNLNQYGRPCFMTYSFRDVVNGLISENKDLLIAVGSFAFIHYAGSADATSNID